MVSLSHERVSVVMETNDETPHEVWVLLTKLSKAHAYIKKSITSILDLQSQMKDSPENWCFGLCSLVQSLQIHRSQSHSNKRKGTCTRESLDSDTVILEQGLCCLGFEIELWHASLCCM